MYLGLYILARVETDGQMVVFCLIMVIIEVCKIVWGFRS